MPKGTENVKLYKVETRGKNRRSQKNERWREREREREREKESTNDFGQVIYQRSPNVV